MSAVLEGIDITKDFKEGRGTAHVLRGVSLRIDPGEIVSLEGPSGSGKTTFLSILGCILTPTTGELFVASHRVPMHRHSALAAVRQKYIGFVFQQYNLFPALTALENVEYALNIKGIRGREARHQATAMIADVGIAERMQAHPRDLSGGQKQRVAIARALAAQPVVLLADEPTANLDSVAAEQILALFRCLAKKDGRGLLIVTHDPKVRAIADRVIQIRDGRIVA
jgi:putative ABC transport system ATP-binding protein